MEELKSVLKDHARRYPNMEPTDAVKLIYQNEFGGGHLIRDVDACLRYLRSEYESIPKDPAATRREYIGNGIYRVNLAALSGEELDQLGRDFIASAAAHKGDLSHFILKLETLRELTAESVFTFDSAQLEEYLTAYEQAGYPMVSHSSTYRALYAPAYRVVPIGSPKGRAMMQKSTAL